MLSIKNTNKSTGNITLSAKPTSEKETSALYENNEKRSE